MSVRLITAPTAEPIDLGALKQHLRVEHGEDDGLILTVAQAAREFCETYTRRFFMSQVWERTLNYFPGAIGLPYPPLQEVVSVTFVDGEGVLQTWADDQYTVDVNGDFAKVYPAYGVVYPTSIRDQPGAIKVQFRVGYGDVPETVAAPAAATTPAAARQAIKLIVGDLYKNREESVTGSTITAIPFAARVLLSTLRVSGGSY